MSGRRHLSIFVAAVVVWMLGAVWYTVLSAPWLAGIGKTQEQLMQQAGGSVVTAYAIGFVAIWALCYLLGWLVARLGADSLAAGAKAGVMAALFCVANIALNYAFEARPVSLWLINGGYVVVGLAVAGAIIGGWKRKAPA